MPRAKICTKQATFTLLQVHAELGGKIIDNKKEADRLAESMRHVEAVLKILDPTFSARPIAVRRKRANPWFKRGTIFRAVLGVLKTATHPLSAGEITASLLRAKGIANPPKAEFDSLVSGVAASLRNHAGKSVAAHDGRPMRWTVN